MVFSCLILHEFTGTNPAPPAIAEKLSGFGDNVVEQFEERGMRFTAGVDAA